MSLEDEKKSARAEAQARRKRAHQDDAGGSSARLSEVLAQYRGTPLSGYMPIRSEIDPLPAMAQAAAHGPVGVPVIMGAGMPLKFSSWQPGASMRTGAFGAQIPVTDAFFEPEILIVPLLAFTRSGDRLGYGGGFYDRTLAKLRAQAGALAIGFAYSAQEAARLPLEPTDERLDLIVTEAEIIDLRAP